MAEMWTNSGLPKFSSSHVKPFAAVAIPELPTPPHSVPAHSGFQPPVCYPASGRNVLPVSS